MKKKSNHAILFILILNIFSSCTTESKNETEDFNVISNSSQKIISYDYNSIEIETMKLINEYRQSLGLNKLKVIDYISYKSEEHDFFMIKTTKVSHEGFAERCANIIKIMGASTVGENIAYNFNSSEAVVAAWLKSPTHKANIVGNYTHFGLAIKKDTKTEKNYFTNIFAKIDSSEKF